MDIDTTAVARRPLRFKPLAALAWVGLLASLMWWVHDTVDSGWPIVATAVCTLAVLKVVDDAWVVREQRRLARR
ncbi:hypothetical protein [Cellulosimicrobium sp. Marseille-Q4280]|uniref:hypothetical protein n=1 Tax=Cellulosimicrobium sp. Marseille-Q4280 TaxID=2937992 RepID=UPI00203AAE45|nr:hypothetical protein [Cellulosimicrobium sp. Marseille-Q4280]